MKHKKTILPIFIGTVLLFLTGCGTGKRETVMEEQLNTKERNQWNVTHYEMDDKYTSAIINEDKIYACYNRDNGVAVSVYNLITQRMETTYALSEVLEVQSISVNSQNEICLLGSTMEGETLWTIKEDGQVCAIENIQLENLGLFTEFRKIFADKDGNYYIWYAMSVPCSEVYEDGETDVYTRLDRIYVKDSQMNTIVYEEVPNSYHNKFIGLYFDEDDQPILLAKDEDGYYTRRVRKENIEKYEENRIELDSEFTKLEEGSFVALNKEGLLYIHDGTIYRYDIPKKCNERLFELAEAGVYEEDILYMGMKEDNIELIDNYWGTDASEYTLIEKGKSEKLQLTVGVMSLQPEMRNIITAYNRYRNDVVIEPVIYAENNDYESGYDRLTLDIIQGTAPDIISVYGIDYENLAQKGAFCDLYSFMNSDTDANRQDFVESVLRAYEMDDCLYSISPTFRIYTMWGAESLVGDSKGIDAANMVQLLENHGGNINSIYGFSADENVLTTLCALSMDRFIDWKEGTCNFTGENFRQILYFAKEYTGKPFDSLYLAIQNKDILLTIGIINSVEDVSMESLLYGEKIQFIGYPTESGSGTAVLFSGDELAVNSKSNFPEESWKFIKYYMEHGFDGTGFPVRKTQFEEFLTDSLKEETIEENGSSYAIAKRSYSERDIVDLQVYKCTDEDVEQIRSLVNDIDIKFQYHTQIQRIIDEETASFFEGDKDLTEVCEIIQNRVQLYLDEKLQQDAFH